MTNIPTRAAGGPRPPRAGRRRGAAGFTLIELMVTLSIGVMLMVVAVPSFVQFRRNADLSDAVSSFIMATSAAKSAALKSGHATFLQAQDPAQGWRSGWRVFVDRDRSNAYSTGDELVMQREPLVADIAVTPTGDTMIAGYLMFTGSGFPRVQGTGALIATTNRVDMAIAGRTTRIHVGTDGRLRSCKLGDSGC